MLLMVEGDRGLVCFGEDKLYFPDKTMKNPQPCLLEDYRVTVEKSTYGFITGKVLSTELVVINEIFGVEQGDVFKSIPLVSGNILVQYKSIVDDSCVIWYKVGGQLKNFSLKLLGAFKKLILTIESLEYSYLDYIKENYKFKSEDKLIECIFKVLSSSHCGLDELSVIDDTFIYYVEKFRYIGSDTHSARYFDNTSLKGLDDAYISTMKRSAKKIKTYKRSDLLSLIEQYGVLVYSISFRHSYPLSFSSRVVGVNVKVNNCGVALYAFDAKNFSMEYYGSEDSAFERELVETSKSMYNDYIKSIVKGVSSKSLVDLIRKYNIKSVLSGSI